MNKVLTCTKFPYYWQLGNVGLNCCTFFPVSEFARLVAANKQIMFSAIWGNKYVSVYTPSCSVFVDLVFLII